VSAANWSAIDGAGPASSSPAGRTPPAASLPSGMTLWAAQVRAMVALELRKALFGRRSLLVYGLAGLPVLVMVVLMVAHRPGGDPVFENLGEARQVFSIIFQTFILRAVIFFGCVGIFTNLFRGEVLDRSLHYYLLSPVRREVLTVGKYLAGLALTWILFVGTVVLCFLMLYPPFGFSRASADLFSGGGLGQLGSYVLVTMLACLGYGSVFLVIGLLFRNPILPAGAVLGWETLHFLLPPMLKRISVIHYLKGLVPVPMSEGPFAVVTEPPPAIVSVVGLLLFTVVAVAAASLLLRRMEIRYGED
jgi:ABC-type transport system involved in multi-copper enzyme maturation permease subunit